MSRCHADDPPHGRRDVVDGEAEMLEQHAGGRGFAEAVDADHGAARIVGGADVLAPAVGDAGFDRDARHALAAARSSR